MAMRVHNTVVQYKEVQYSTAQNGLARQDTRQHLTILLVRYSTARNGMVQYSTAQYST